MHGFTDTFVAALFCAFVCSSMEKTVTIRFFGSLNDFLPARMHHKQLKHKVAAAQTVKDAVEAIGVPHPEVAVLLVNGKSVGFSYQPLPGDEILVYPRAFSAQFPDACSLRKLPPYPLAFVLDVHVGTLARALRMLGFNASYRNDYTDTEIAQLAHTENRVVLTRDVGLLKLKAVEWGYWLRSQHLREQLQEVIGYFGLQSKWQPFTRCIACNGIISEVTKASVLQQLPPKTRLYYEQFYQCHSCRRVYWKGSHYNSMQEFIHQVLNP